jgi:hypothetical protein
MKTGKQFRYWLAAGTPMISCRCMIALLVLLMVRSAHADPEVVAWGSNEYGQTDVPAGLSNLVAVAAGNVHSLALTEDGRVVAWGDNRYGQTDVPSGLSDVVAMAAEAFHSLALLRQPTVPTPRLQLSRGNSGLSLQAQGVQGISCQLLHASQLPGRWLPSQPVTFTNTVHRFNAPNASNPAQFYRLLRK